jgi:Leucine-rich repeat (LRR) protein
MYKKYLIAITVFVFIVFSVAPELKAQVPVSDSLALVALYDSTDGPDWSVNSNWLTAQPVSDWYGIIVTSGRVSSIVLNSNNLSGSLPAEIGDLTGLTDLQLFNNHLSGTLPPAIGNLTKLENLYLSSNKIAGSIPASLGNLTQLRALNIGSNDLSGQIPVELGNLDSLISLVIPNGTLSGTLPEELGNLTRLQYINLSNNQLSGSVPEAIGNLPNLRQLNIGYNQIMDPIPAGIMNSTLINQLGLSWNQFTGTIPTGIGNMSNLVDLSLAHNQFTGTLPAELGNLSYLKWLDVSGNQLSGSVPLEYQNLSSLQNFNLNDNQLSDLPDLSSISGLSGIAIQNNRFTFEDIENNISIPGITYVPQENVGTPLDTTLETGSDITLSVTVGGNFKQYQWYKGNNLLSGADADTYPLTAVALDDSGSYTCQVTNSVVPDLIIYSNPFHLKVITSLRATDSLALVAVYNSTGGANWNDKTNWLTAEPIDNWYGVTVSNQRVVQLLLGANNLAGSLPEEIGNLTALEHLILYGNHIVSPLPAGLQNMTGLVELVLNGNELTGAIPPGIYGMTNLQFLNFVNNQMTGTISPQIGNLTNLKYLALSTNQFSGTLPAELRNLIHLTALFTDHNQLTGSIPADLENLTDVSLLYLSDNKLSGSVPAGLVNLTKLSDFAINNNQLDSLPDLSSLAGLSTLSIQSNRFTFEDIEPNIGIPNFNYWPQDSVGTETDTTILSGGSMEMSVAVGGTANHYQWMKNEVDIPGAENSTYVISSAQPTDAGSYLCKIGNTIATNLTLYSRPVRVTIDNSSGLSGGSTAIPDQYQLFQNYPNPFNPLTQIRFTLPEAARVRMVVYNILGRPVMTILDEKRQAGFHTVTLNSTHLTSGVYFCSIRANSFATVIKMVLLK